MFEKDQIVLVDTNVILEAHRVTCWNTLASYFRLATVETVVEETQTGFQNRSPAQTIQLAPLRGSFHHIENITNEARAQFALDNPNVLLDPGERDLIIYARSLDPKTTWFLNSPDMAAVRYCHHSKWLDRLVSLEAMNKHISAHTTSNLRDNFSENWLSVRKTKLLLGM
ncbi:hypothetical protein HX787_28090 [Pseudomonas tolaasii]|jgi:hypothetical protein|uniref:PIN domain-containing protein n=1 Tax=Pseudomonas tolaasii TaxID=29442 RepID=A0A7Y8DSJ8_PSETO|nr:MULTISPECIES: hypothetical protein [Pseudomonas]MCI1738630.1 hypothetical protein [Pseudomonas veronii]KMM86374.1 hypothetical protein TU74_19510 [Pseudomonas lundensis]MBY8941087.1 hypothetical protein [Pseudomonas tolaasii]NNA22700.1 hypothetical protein [Pseudomonas lundensis]NWC19745.1 hypothetical protein [Pseudomonas tolaasii]